MKKLGKICIICTKKIIEKKERWVRLTDFNKGNEVGTVFYHLECWRDRFRISNSQRKQEMYRQTQQAMGSILGALNKNPKQVFEIPGH